MYRQSASPALRSTQYGTQLRQKDRSGSPSKKSKNSLIHVTKIEKKILDDPRKMERFSSQGQEELV